MANHTLAVEIRTTESKHYLGKRFVAGLDRIGQEVPGAYGELYARLALAGVVPDGHPFLIASRPDDGRMEIEVGVPCATPPENGQLFAGTLPGGRVAVVVHRGAYDAIGPIYEALSRWIVENGYLMAGPPREVYLNGPEDVSSPDEHLTEIVWPIG